MEGADTGAELAGLAELRAMDAGMPAVAILGLPHEPLLVREPDWSVSRPILENGDARAAWALPVWGEWRERELRSFIVARLAGLPRALGGTRRVN